MSKDREAEMLAALRTPTKRVSAKTSAPARKAATKSGRGKPINLYLHPEDLMKIRSLVSYLSAQGERVSDSQVVKSALIVAEGNEALLAAFHEVGERDQRFKKARDAKSASA